MLCPGFWGSLPRASYHRPHGEQALHEVGQLLGSVHPQWMYSYCCPGLFQYKVELLQDTIKLHFFTSDFDQNS